MIVILIAAIVAAAAIGLFIYFQRQRTNQEDLSPYSINSDTGNPRVLIATQKSEYKDSVMDEISRHYKGGDIYISVIDVAQLSGVQPAEWDKIVIFSAIKVYQFHPAVVKFLDRQSGSYSGRIFMYNTSEGSNMRYGDVDAVTSASINPSLGSAGIIEAIDNALGLRK